MVFSIIFDQSHFDGVMLRFRLFPCPQPNKTNSISNARTTASIFSSHSVTTPITPTCDSPLLPNTSATVSNVSVQSPFRRHRPRRQTLRSCGRPVSSPPSCSMDSTESDIKLCSNCDSNKKKQYQTYDPLKGLVLVQPDNDKREYESSSSSSYSSSPHDHPTAVPEIRQYLPNPLESVGQVVHLTSWIEVASAESAFRYSIFSVLAVMEDGQVRLWNLNPHISYPVDHQLFHPDFLYPTTIWPALHIPDPLLPDLCLETSLNNHLNRRSSLLPQSDEFGPQILNPPFPGLSISWFTCRRLFTMSHLRDNFTHDSSEIGPIVWISAGYDGQVFGRQLTSSERTNTSAPANCGVDSSTIHGWSLNLHSAHRSHVICDADVDSSGFWLATASVDQTCKIWCLRTQTQIFSTSQKSCIRSCRFRPVFAPDELYLATGNDSGLLMIWHIILPQRYVISFA
ncbi:unnamed protein product [Protopolystoma xenopodis]|uniref:Uncharacterized protein n=1 Tax=Protopolystoma xenopodis TaxID=117903 RepID=A0A448WB08_9PLAT|nr:unnamed protein product [Protopolystoma xenopodis]